MRYYFLLMGINGVFESWKLNIKLMFLGQEHSSLVEYALCTCSTHAFEKREGMKFLVK